MLKVFLADIRDNKGLHTDANELSDDRILAVTDIPKIGGVWNSVNRSTAGTSIISTPDNDQAIVLTDLIISGDRVNSASIEIQFNDDTRTESIFLADVTDAPVNIAHTFNGRAAGWKNARLEVVTVSTVNATVYLGYYKTPESLTYSEWTALR